MDRTLNILLRLTENKAANDALLRDVERRIKTAVNPDQADRQSSATTNRLTILQQQLANQQVLIQQRAAVQASALQQQANNAQATNAQRAAAQQAAIHQRAAAAAIQQQQRAQAQQLEQQQQFTNQQALLAQRATDQQVAIQQRFVNQQAAIQQRAAAAAAQQQQNTQARINAQQQQFANQQALLAQRADAQQAAIQQRFANQQAVLQQRQQQRNNNNGFLGGILRNASTIRESGESLTNVGYALTGVTNRLLDFGRAAVSSATDIDQQVNVLKALTGSATVAEARFKSLVEISRRTPGLTSNLAATLDAQLRTSNVSEANIDKILPAIGRLNAVAPLGNPQGFASNLIQLITQNFERADLKELVGNSPLAGQIIAQIFKVDSPINSKAIRESAKRLGIDTTDEFFAAFADAAAKNTKLANVSESLATRFDKLRDRVSVALRPVGVSIIESLIPLVERAIPIIERAADAFGDMPQSTRETAVGLGLLTVAAGPATIALGSVVQSVGALGNLAGVVGGAAGLGGVGASVTALAAVIAGAAIEAKALHDAYQTNLLGIRTTVATFVTEATTFWAKYGDDIKSLTANAWEFIQRNITSRASSVLKVVTGILQIINGNWRQGLSSLATGAVDVLRGLPGTMLDIAHQAAAGLARGLVNGTKDVAAATVTMVRAATQAATLTLGIQSPSKEFFKIGQAVGDGFILGVRAKQPDVFNFLNQTFSQATVLTQDAVGRLAAQFATIDSLSTSFSNVQRRGDFASELQGRRVNDLAGVLRGLAKPSKPLPAVTPSVAPALSDTLKGFGRGKGVAEETELQQLTKRLAEVNREILDLETRTRPEYKLKLQIEGAEETRKTLTELIQVQAELGIRPQTPTTRQVKVPVSKQNPRGIVEIADIDEARRQLAAFKEIQERPISNQFAGLLGGVGKIDAELSTAKIEAETTRLEKQGKLLEQQTKIVDYLTDTANNLAEQLEEVGDTSNELRERRKLRTRNLDVNSSESAEILRLAKALDDRDARAIAAEKQKKALDQAKRQYEEFVQSLEGVFNDAFERGPKAFLDNFLSYTKRIGARILAEFTTNILGRIVQRTSVTAGGGSQQTGGLLQLSPSAAGGNSGGFSFGGFNFPGIGPGGTGTFTGAPVNLGGGSTSAGGASSVGGIRGLINQISGFPIFGARAASATPTIVGGLPTLPNVPIPPIQAPGATAAATPSAFAGLGAAGLLAGGGLLGSLAGGQSRTGRLLGGLGGTLGAGFIGASGLLGGSAAAGTGIAGSFGALAPLLTNPITAIVAGGLIGTALLVRAFANRDLKKLAGTIKEVHAVDVPTKGEGLAILKQVKEIGQQQFGKKWLDQRNDLVKQQSVIDLLTTYAVGTNQTGSALYRNKQLADPFSSANNFVRRLNGGPIPGATLGRDYIPALLDGNEYVSAARTVQREGLSKFTALEAGLATITTKDSGGNAEMAALFARLETRDRQFEAMLARLGNTLSRVEGIPADHMLAMGLDRNPDVLAGALDRAQTSGNLYGFTDKLSQ